MGLIKALTNAGKETLADQYKEFIYCESLPTDILISKGSKQVLRGNTNNGNDNIITDGSKIAVADGQCMIIVENGRVIEFSAEPGEYIYKTGTTPSLLTGRLPGLANSFKTLWGRTQAGGMQDNDQRVYYINTKEIIGNKVGAGDIPFRDSEFNFTMNIGFFGEYSYKITDPLLFYKNVAGNVKSEYKRLEIDSQLKAEIQNSIQPALGRIALKKISYDQLPLFAKEIANELNVELTEEWVSKRGISIFSFALASVTPDEESAKKIEQFQTNRVYTNTQMMGARLGEAQANAMESAAQNENGAMMGFMSLGMAQHSGGMNAAQMFEMDKDEDEENQNSWKCNTCGIDNDGKFCKECGKENQDSSWICSCGKINDGKFCSECGKENIDTTCEKCGFTGKDSFKFCPSCGSKNE